MEASVKNFIVAHDMTKKAAGWVQIVGSRACRGKGGAKTENELGDFVHKVRAGPPWQPRIVLNDVNVLYTSISLFSGTKMEELQMIIKQESVDIVGITETWGW